MKWTRYLSLIGIILFIYILSKLDISRVLEEIENANLNYLLITVFLTFVLIIVQPFKWWIIARLQKINVPYKAAIKINLASGFFYGFITPSKLGIVTRAGYLRDYSNSYSKGFSNVVIDKALDLSSLFLFAIILGFIFHNKIPFFSAGLFLIIFIVMIGSFVFFSSKERTKNSLRFLYRHFVPEKSKERIKGSFEAFYEDMPKKRQLAGVFLLNMLVWMLIYATTYFVGLSLGINLPFVYYLALLPIGTLVAQIPITINGLGTREVTLIKLFGIFGISAEKTFSMSILSLIITGLIPAIVALFFIFKKDLK